MNEYVCTENTVPYPRVTQLQIIGGNEIVRAEHTVSYPRVIHTQIIESMKV